jgi:hypothetical protein
MPSMNTREIQDQVVTKAEIFSALIHYCELKKLILSTLEFGWKTTGSKKHKTPKYIKNLVRPFYTILTIVRFTDLSLGRICYGPRHFARIFYYLAKVWLYHGPR